MNIPSIKLNEAAEINPRSRARLTIDTPVSFLGMADVDAGSGTTSRGKERRFEEVAKGYTQFIDGDLLVAKITPCFENGKIAQAQLEHHNGCGSTEFHVVRPDRSRFDDRFLLRFLRQPYVRLVGELRMTGSAGQRRVPEAYLADLRVPLLPLEEQQRIAQVLDCVDVLRAKRRKTIALLDDLAKSIFLDMFGIGIERGEWQRRSLQEIVKTGTIVTYGIVQAGDEYPGGVPYIRTGDIQNGEILSSQLRETDPEIARKYGRSRVELNDIVMSIRATVGTTALVTAETAGANLTQGTARISPGELTHHLYLLHYLRSKRAQDWIGRQVKGATFREITLAKLRELSVALPPMSLQREFAARVDAVNHLHHSQAMHLAELDDLFGSLQHQAFRGGLWDSIAA